MRKLLLLFLLISFVTSIAVYGQKAKFGITAGMSLANMHVKSGDISVSADSKIGFSAGVLADIGISSQFSFQPAVNFVQKGYKTTMPGIDYKSELTLNYIEVPLNLVFKPEMKGVQFFVGAGPSLAYAISGKEKEEDAVSKQHINTNSVITLMSMI